MNTARVLDEMAIMRRKMTNSEIKTMNIHTSTSITMDAAFRTFRDEVFMEKGSLFFFLYSANISHNPITVSIPMTWRLEANKK